MLLRQISYYLVTTIRFALCLLCAAGCVYFVGLWSGLIPDAERQQQESRARLVETVTARSADAIDRLQWRPLGQAFRVLAIGNPDIESIGYRTTSGTLKLATNEHEFHWNRQSPTLHRVRRSIEGKGGPHGSLEFCFANTPRPFWLGYQTQATLFVIFAIYLTHVFFCWWIPRSREAIEVVPPRVREALDTLSEGVVLLDSQERILLANTAFAQMCDSTSGALLGRKASSLPWVLAEDANPEEFPWIDAMEEQAPQMDRRLHLELPGGHQRIFSVISKPTGATRRAHRGALATFRDVTEVEEHRAQLESMLVMLKSNRDEISRKNQELQQLATKDSLTGCLNRRAFFERFDRLWKTCQRDGQPLSCVMVDNDHFKKINDTYGHHTGDRVLIRVAQALRELNPDERLVCRYGGEEFCIALPGIDAARAELAAEQMRSAIADIRIEEQPDLELSASLGVSDLQFGAATPQDLINQADKALYTAKNRGRNLVVCYADDLPSHEPAPPAPIESAMVDEGEIPYPAVSALLSGLTYRDSDTANHCRRVADYCVAAGQGLLEPREIYLVELAAQLHDIGKLGLPDEILLSTAPLSDSQWEVLARHERLGIELINETFGNDDLTTIVRTARGRFDGENPNRHLPHGAAIPAAARLLAIADSFDSMVTDRPYRAGRSLDEAFEELRRCKGSQFDPDLVEHFIEAISARTATQSNGGFHSEHEGFGHQIQRLAEALDARDVEGIVALASRLKETALRQHAVPIADVADSLQRCAQQEEPQLLQLVKLTGQLLAIVQDDKPAAAPASNAASTA